MNFEGFLLFWQKNQLVKNWPRTIKTFTIIVSFPEAHLIPVLRPGIGPAENSLLPPAACNPLDLMIERV